MSSKSMLSCSVHNYKDIMKKSAISKILITSSPILQSSLIFSLHYSWLHWCGVFLQEKRINCTKSKCILREAPWSNLQNFDMQKIMGFLLLFLMTTYKYKAIKETITLPREPVDQVLKSLLGKPGALPGIVWFYCAFPSQSLLLLYRNVPALPPSAKLLPVSFSHALAFHISFKRKMQG